MTHSTNSTIGNMTNTCGSVAVTPGWRQARGYSYSYSYNELLQSFVMLQSFVNGEPL